MSDVLLTGAQGGIGQMIGKTLKQHGFSIHPTTREDTDLSDEVAVRALRDRTGPVDWVVCSHGYIDEETQFENQSPQSIENTFATNALSLFWLARAFLPTLSKGMVVISSSAGITPNGRFAAYSASKAAANAFIEALARNRPEQRFFAVCPGPTNTEMRERVARDASQMQSPSAVAEVVAQILSDANSYKSGDTILVKDGMTSIAKRV